MILIIDELKTFISVVEHNNFTKAAEAINLSQPAVSQHVKSLEALYDVKIIKRSYKEKKISITPAGKILYIRAKEIISLLREVEYEMDMYKSEITGKVKIGCSYTIGEFFLPKFLGEFSKRYEGVEFDITIDNTKNICSKVKKLEIDLGLVEGSFSEDDFLYDVFKDDYLKLAVPKGFTDGEKKFRKRDFENVIWVSREEGSGTREQLEKFLKNNNILPKKIIVFGSNYSVKEAVRYGLGVTLISESVLKEAIELNEIDIIKTKQITKRKFNYILMKENIHSNLVSIIIKMLKEFEEVKTRANI